MPAKAGGEGGGGGRAEIEDEVFVVGDEGDAVDGFGSE